MKRFSMFLALGGLVGGWTAACGDGESCTPGTVDCACTSEGSCDYTLMCEANVCVPDPGVTTGTDTTPTTVTGTTDGGSDTGTAAGAPEILTFTTSVVSITEGGFVGFSAKVTDPDGLDDIVSVTLTTMDQAGVYGDMTDDGMGDYSLGLSWDDMHAVDPIEFDKPIMRPFLLTDTDSSNQTASETVEVMLSCNAIDACDGKCVDTLVADDNCGACGVVCPMGGGIGGCTAGACEPALYECLEPAGTTSCDDYCATQGQTCVEDGCGTSTYVLYDDMQMCTDYTAAVAQGTPCNVNVNFAIAPGYAFARCCCTAN